MQRAHDERAMNATTMPMHFEREEPGLFGPLVLAVLVHLLLFGVLFVGVRWQSRPPEPVSVELWLPPTPPRAEVKPEPVAPPKVEPKPEPRIEPPAPKPEPRVEPPKPEIAVPEKPKPIPKPKPKPEPVKPAPPKPRDQEVQKRLREEIARAQSQLKIDQERELIKEQLNREQASMQQKALAAYTDKIKAKIKGNIILPQDIKGNPEAIFDVVQLPTGEVLPPVRLKKSSGHRGYDAAVERAILKSSPLPRPEKGELFYRELTLKFKPLD
jgi:colicin import membrane protein